MIFLALTTHDISSVLVLCKKGNQLAQVEVYNRYNRAMYNVALRIVKDTALAEDCMQESFIAAFHKMDSFKGTASFGAWLKRIVINNSLVAYKKSQKFVAFNDETTKSLETDDVNGMVSEEYEAIRSQQLLKCLNELHSSYSQILTLHFIEGFDYEEICEILNISYANCRTLVSRAKESLRKKLREI